MVKREIAYVPLDKTTPSVQAPTKIDIPTYPDAGVEFAGYSKTLLAGNQYKINPQERASFSQSTTFLGGETSTTYTNPFLGKKDFYVDTIIIFVYRQALPAGVSLQMILDDTSQNKLILMENTNSTYTSFTISFNTPILFPKDKNFRIIYSLARALLDNTKINLYGWTE